MSVALPSWRHFEEGINPWVPEGSAVVRKDLTDPRWGGACGLCITGGVADFEGMATGTAPANEAVITAATQYTLSVYVKFPVAVGDEFTIFCAQYTAAGVHVINASDLFEGTGVWSRFSITFTSQATGVRLRDFRVMSRVVGASRTFRVDGWQLDTGATAQTYDGNDAQTIGTRLGATCRRRMFRQRPRRRRNYA
jgi:hypothetical protein